MACRQLLLPAMFPAVMPAGCGSWKDLTVFSFAHGRTPVTLYTDRDEKEPYANSFSGMDTTLVLIFRGDGFNRAWMKISREFFVWNWPAWSCARFSLPVACARFFHVRFFCVLPWLEHVHRSWLRQAPSCALLWLCPWLAQLRKVQYQLRWQNQPKQGTWRSTARLQSFSW